MLKLVLVVVQLLWPLSFFRSNKRSKSNPKSSRVPWQLKGLCWDIHWRGCGQKGISWQLLLLQPRTLWFYKRSKRLGAENLEWSCSRQTWIPVHPRTAWERAEPWWLVECSSGRQSPLTSSGILSMTIEYLIMAVRFHPVQQCCSRLQ